MRHHPNELLVSGALELSKLLGELLDEQEAARKTAIDEPAMVALDAPGAKQPDDPRLSGTERGERVSER